MNSFKKLYSAVALLGLVAAAPLTQAASPLEPGTYTIDPAHSKVGFEVPHLVISSVEGRFSDFSGDIVAGSKLTDAKIQATVKTASIDTANGKRDEHLRSPDFFDSEKFPAMTFKSKKITGSPENFKMTGDLTLHGVTKEVTLNGKYLGTVADAWGNQKIAFDASGKINRKDFGLTWNKMVEAGPSVGDEVTLQLKVQAAKAKKADAGKDAK